jgi:hypothetical protein
MGAVAKSYMRVTSSFIEHNSTEPDFILSPFFLAFTENVAVLVNKNRKETHPACR